MRLLAHISCFDCLRMQAFSSNSHSLIHFGKVYTIVFEIQSNEFCNYTMKYVNTFNGMKRMNFMGGKASVRGVERERERDL